ncbi:MAG: hypothetical protein ABJM26_06705 [Anderseniella sp.]
MKHSETGYRLKFVVNTALGCLVSLMIIVGLGSAALVLSESHKSTENIEAAVREALETGPFDRDGQRVIWHYQSNFAECQVVSMGLKIQGTALQSAFRALSIRWKKPDPYCHQLASYLDGGEQPWRSYFRYWHGSRLVMHPVLSHASYRTLQVICYGLLFVSVASMLVMTGMSLGTGYALALTLSLVVTTDTILRGFSPTHAVSLSALTLLVGIISWSLTRNPDNLRSIILTCFTAGAVYNYFDFLYNIELLVLLAGVVFWKTSVTDFREFKTGAIGIVTCQAAVLSGFVAMWGAKWLLMAVIGTGSSTSWFPAGNIGTWLAGGNQQYVALAALLANGHKAWMYGVNMVVLPVALTVGAVAAFVCWRQKRIQLLALLCVALLVPAAIMEGKSTHSIVHAGFTSKVVSMAFMILAIGAVWAVFSGRRRQ